MNRHPLAQLQRLSTIPAHLPDAFSASWQSPSNIALVKYWGKKEGQLPANPSLSMTLDEAVTRTTVHFRRDGTPGIGPVNGDPAHPFLPRLQGLFAWLVKEVPVLSHYSLEVVTESTFPHSTGIASSASGLSAFALCLLDAATGLTGAVCSQTDTMKMASFVARMGSGSACRSLYEGFTVWGRTRLIPGSSDEWAVPVMDRIHPSMQSLRDAILVISRQPKSLSSSLGHRAMDNHPFASSRYRQARKNLAEVLEALSSGDFDRLGDIAENEALSLHALLMTSGDGALLMKPGTLEAIGHIREARLQGLPVFFTLDAGPNIHLFYPEQDSRRVGSFITDALAPLCAGKEVILDRCGKGPRPLRAEPSTP